MAKVSKQFKKFASSGKLKDTIKTRRKNQEIKRKVEDRNQRRAHQRGAAKERPGAGSHRRALDEGLEEGDDEEDDEREVKRLSKAGGKAGGIARNVEELFGGQLEGGAGDEEEVSELDDLEEDDEEEEEEEEDYDDEDEDDELSDLGMDEAEMEKAMKNLEKKDPEFWKYLKENDRDLLDFGGQGQGNGGSSSKRGQRKAKLDEDEEEDEESDGDDEEEVDEDGDEVDEEQDMDIAPKKTNVNLRMLRGWQQGMIKQHSLRSLRKTLLAFRAAAHMNEEDADQGTGRDTKYTVDSPVVFNKLVLTALKFTPVVLAHHIPFRTLPDGRIKTSQPKKPNQSLNRLILSHITTLLHFMKSLPAMSSSTQDGEAALLLVEAIGESGKLVPWLLGARKHLRAYLKTLLDLWSAGSDNVKIASFLAVRKLYIAGDDALRDLCLKNTYKSLLPTLRHTTPHTLPSINILKNTAAELFCLNPSRSYPQAFTFIRTLAVHLRNVVRGTTSAPSKAKGGKSTDTAEAFRSVYNWQYVHCIDFWTQVLSSSCDVDAQRDRGGVESELKPLIYPLVQIALGVVRLLPSSRYFPLRFHILHSLLRLINRTNTYIPLSPFLLEILDSAEFKRQNPQKSTLKPLDLEYIIRAPPSYPKTRIYQETLGEELVFLLGEYHAALSSQIAFPEMVLPVLVTLRRHLKKGSAGSPKVQSGFKVLLEKLESSSKWVEGKRRNVGFAPKDRGELVKWAEKTKIDDTPVGSWIKVQRKVREKRRQEVEKAFREERAGKGARGEEEKEDEEEDDAMSDVEEVEEDEDEEEAEAEFE
ncbi:Noc2p family-domain-containing protein [Kockovaella imperatae]|uniref:Noc2p family-domain-containing protein n=1 Tax=Kockovaella imperatae TaxID=4999 RepID=A0A1Y1UFF3_9TREE|nr:Noc2p family-domain-containing protein [Kockovaella imperatae]ORX36257.1 Noc2p family-domain-containing protein [Kockovaella imperatae]